MLIEFCTNFYNLPDIKLSLGASTYDWNKQALKNGFVNNVLIFGPNGSGKSRILSAINQIAALQFKNVRRDGLENTYLKYVFRFGEDTVIFLSEQSHSKVTLFVNGLDTPIFDIENEIVQKFHRYINGIHYVHEYPITYIPEDCSLLLCEDVAQTLDYNKVAETAIYVSQLKCQVIGASNNTLLISNDYLRPDCYFNLVNSKPYAFNTLTSKDLRKAHNLERIYRALGFENTGESYES